MSTTPHDLSGESAEAVRAKLTQEWDIRGIDVATLKVDKRGTIGPKYRGTTKVDAGGGGSAIEAGVTFLSQYTRFEDMSRDYE